MWEVFFFLNNFFPHLIFWRIRSGWKMTALVKVTWSALGQSQTRMGKCSKNAFFETRTLLRTLIRATCNNSWLEKDIFSLEFSRLISGWGWDSDVTWPATDQSEPAIETRFLGSDSRKHLRDIHLPIHPNSLAVMDLIELSRDDVHQFDKCNWFLTNGSEAITKLTWRSIPGKWSGAGFNPIAKWMRNGLSMTSP